ncbi:helix-turn-helix domain-containing protein [Spirulina sp.]|uniref:helix-turn-helix domain-containing protein n=1 Tax=Spirulina sp. TaxID=1157 RepID=UPI003F6FBA3D
MKSRYQYRIYPTPGQQTELAKLFGCCRVVWNDALALIKRVDISSVLWWRWSL